MKLMLIAALGLFACATTSPMSDSGTGACSTATAGRGTIVYSSPDNTSRPVETLSSSAQVCADSQTVGFGFRHVKLGDGRDGYVSDNDLSI